MKIHLDAGGAYNLIRAYGPGHVKVNEQVYAGNLVLMPDRVIPDWAPARFEDLTADHLAGLAELAPEVVILGTGARLRFPQAGVMRPLVSAQIGLEVMDTGAACRTYNILAGEGRRVLAALIMIEAPGRGGQNSESME